MFIEHDACSFSVCSTHIIIVPAVFFYLPIYSDKQNNPKFEKTSYPIQPAPTLKKKKKSMKKSCDDNFLNKIIKKIKE